MSKQTKISFGETMLKTRNFYALKRVFSTQKANNPQICIVGAGPAGFYAAQHFVKKLGHAQIDIYERLPVPFGLVRFGVAPDHPDVKNVIHTFTKTAKNPNVRFIGNVNLGTDVSLEQLRKFYHVVVLAYGADENRTLNVKGETLANVIPARQIVGWYNGLPWNSDLNINLDGETAVIIGQGNVAIDVARILMTPIDELRKTDITSFALEQISRSKIKKFYLIGRRGPLQAAFTIKELREMLKLGGCSTVWRKEDFEGVAAHIPNLPRPKKRITELMLKSLEEQKPPSGKIFNPVFLRSPLEFRGNNKVEGVVLGVNELEGEDMLNRKAVLTKETENLKCDLGITSIGWL
ncbi:NADPH:adrenodoxin oxidoreductase, mitochondrial isoform X2 [Cylas formicarius]|uniref:NADPH:adrenodoxin oxidoreductase, mitochondrial isoform X2 n=1 Tax=Cylas formicarius TaxID=197179 RepID=UPI0029589CA7|nr:NADPH:adrenodoxin oxidoreductase, mitochondrial isoform X2 [Cylas formicarius]